MPGRLHVALCVHCTWEAGLRLLGAAKQSVGTGSTYTCRCVQHMEQAVVTLHQWLCAARRASCAEAACWLHLCTSLVPRVSGRVL